MLSVDIAKFLRTFYFYRTPPVASSDSPSLFDSKVSWSICSLISHLHVLSILIKNLHTKVAQIIIYYHITKQFLPCLNWLITCFRFRNMFWKNISCFRFWWKTYTKRCTNNYVISRLKRLCLPALWGWSSAFNFRIWFGKWKNAV